MCPSAPLPSGSARGPPFDSAQTKQRPDRVGIQNNSLPVPRRAEVNRSATPLLGSLGPPRRALGSREPIRDALNCIPENHPGHRERVPQTRLRFLSRCADREISQTDRDAQIAPESEQRSARPTGAHKLRTGTHRARGAVGPLYLYRKSRSVFARSAHFFAVCRCRGWRHAL